MSSDVQQRGRYVIIGPPGTGKTTYLAQKTKDFAAWAAKWCPEKRRPILLCSLTRAAAAEIAGRDLPIPRECIGTLHSHAYRSLGGGLIAESQISDFNSTVEPPYQISGGDADTDDPAWDRPIISPGDKLAGEYHLLRARMTPRQQWPAPNVAWGNTWEKWKAEVGAMDFTDMIERAYREVDFPPGNPEIVVADEAQDLSALEYALLNRWGQACGRLIVCGDPYQALYTWRGAHPELFLDPDIPADHRRVLAQSYRVPCRVHRAATEWIRQLSTYQPIEYKPRDAEGRVETCRANWKLPEAAVEIARDQLDQGKSVMMAASCSFFLPPLIHVLRSQGIPFANPWRTRRGDWNPLGGSGVTMRQRISEFMQYDPGTHGDDFRIWTYEEFHHWTAPLKAEGLIRPGVKAEIPRLAEGNKDALMTAEEIRQVFEDEPAAELSRLLLLGDTAGLLAWWRSHLLATKAGTATYPLQVARAHGVTELDQTPRLYVGTIHSFKGAEADVVFLFPDLSPSEYKEWVSCDSRDNVVRMFYVGITRARETLYLCKRLSPLSVPLEILCHD